ncbi:uncharacterized protein LOC106637317 [Copidosoma floridanum]|uniref:uncharacterized protein LOC106637317 n=1 Tax=Copidosoma floridanum TaxID=29053 RepID=UPI0006C95F67|nr:uncharacterized protein LOC106637317 [Copidosoma floridanum]
MWCLSRRVLSFGLRMTLRRMQDNVTNMQNLRRTVMLTHQNSFSLSRSIMSRIKYEPALKSEPPKLEDEGHKKSGKNLVLNRHQLGKVEGKLMLGFTCKRCNTRNENKIITKLAYNKGVVIVRCDGCKNNHLIADNLGWFGPGHKTRNIETILRQKGESVCRIRDDIGGYFEAIAEEEVIKVQRRIKEQELIDDSAIKSEESPKIEEGGKNN